MLYIAESGKKRTLRGRWLDVCPFRRIYNAYLQQSWNLECMPEEGRTWFYIKSPGADLGFPKRAPKAQASSGVRERAPSGNFLDFFSLKSPFQGFRVIQKGFQLGKCFFCVCVNIFIMKNVTDFGKTVEIGVDPRLVAVKLHVVYHTVKFRK